MLLANDITLSVIFCISSAIFMALASFLLRDVEPRPDMPERHSRVICTLNHILSAYLIFAGICMAVMIFFVGHVPMGWLWAFLVFGVVTAMILFVAALCNMDSVAGIAIYIVSIMLIWLLMYDVAIALKFPMFGLMLILCMPIAAIGFGIAKYLWSYGTFLEMESGGERGHGHKVASTILNIFTAILLIATILFGIIAPKQPNSGGGITDADIADVSDLSVTKVTDDDLAELELSTYPYSDEMLLSSLGVCDDSRVKKSGFSDAVTFPYESNDSEKMIVETEEEIFRNPIYGQMMAKGLKDKYPCGAKKSIGELNPWMSELLSKKWHEWCVKTTDPESGESTIRVSHEYRLLAATMCNLLHQFAPQGIQAHQTVENWRLNTPVGKDTDRDTMLAEYQYTRDALIFAYIPKDKAGSKDFKDLFVFGLNIHDKRIEFYGEEDEPEVTKTPSSGSSTPSGGSDTPSSDNPKSNPTEKPSPSPSPTEPGNPYNKDPNKAPKTNTEKNDDPGPGPNTNNGVGSNISAADSQYNSGNSSMKENQNTQEEQKAKNQNSSNTPSTKSNGNVDNPDAGADLSTPVQDSGRTGGHALTDDEDGGDWGSPPD